MKAILNSVKGFKNTGKAFRMVVLLFAINFIFSLILTVPLYQSLKNSIGQSQVGEKLSEGFDYIWWEEFKDESKGLATTFTPSIIGPGALLNNLENIVQMKLFHLPPIVLVLGLIYITLHTFLAGGILHVFNQKSINFTMKDFFQGAGSYFARFFLIMLISWLFFIPVCIYLSPGFSSLLDNVSRNSLTEITPFLLGIFLSTIILFLILIIQMVFDYARIHTVAEKKRNVAEATLEGFSFVIHHPGSTLVLYYLIFTVSLAGAAIYALIKGLIPQSSIPGILTSFILQQMFIFMVIWVRCWLYSSQLELYKYLR